jgi:DNA-binding transcriptional MerR regulator
MPSQTCLRIGDLARETGKSVRALRYYEEFGLLEPQGHTEGGFRLYHQEDVSRVRLIERLQELGFPLERIRNILGAWSQKGRGEDVAPKLKALLEESLLDTQARLRKLQGVEAEIQEAMRFLSACGTCQERPGRERCSECEKGDHQARLPQLMEALIR